MNIINGKLRREIVLIIVTAVIGILVGIGATAVVTWADVSKLQQTTVVNKERALENAARIDAILSRLTAIDKGISRIEGLLERPRQVVE